MRQSRLTNSSFRDWSYFGFGLWSASGESGAESGEKRLAKRSRSATSRRRAADGSLPHSRHSGECPLVTSARICVVERAWSRGRTGPTGSPWSEANRALVTAMGKVGVASFSALDRRNSQLKAVDSPGVGLVQPCSSEVYGTARYV